MERAFQDYGETLENVTAFKYMGRVLTEGYEDWLEVEGNLQKARKSWVNMSRILIREGGPEGIGALLQRGSTGGVAF